MSPEELVGLNDIASEKGKLLVQKQRAAVKSRARRLKMRMIAEGFLLAKLQSVQVRYNRNVLT